jgi:hypothetical protein
MASLHHEMKMEAVTKLVVASEVVGVGGYRQSRKKNTVD